MRQKNLWKELKDKFLNVNSLAYAVLVCLLGLGLVGAFNSIPPTMSQSVITGLKTIFHFIWEVIKIIILFVGPFFAAWGIKWVIWLVDDLTPGHDFSPLARNILLFGVVACLTIWWVVFPDKLVEPKSFWATELPGHTYEAPHFVYALFALIGSLIAVFGSNDDASFG